MGTISEKLTYLNGTKQAIKQAINEDFEVIDNNTTFREYADEISSNNAKYKDLIPKETTNATNTLDISNSAGLDKALVTQYGNTYQETTTGKNLFDVNLVTSVTNGSISDEIITTNETSDSTYSVFPYFPNISLPANTYYLSMDIRIKSGTGYFNKINDATTDWTAVSKPSLSTTFQRYVYSHTYTSVTTLNHILIQFISSTNAVYEITNIMLSTSSDTNYEKYSGGNPAPNPDYPQEIVNISGKSTLKDVGKQLFDKTTAEVGKYVTENGELGNSNNFSASDYIQVVSGNSYTYSGCHMYDTFASGGAYYDENKGFVSSFKMQYSGTITIPQNAKYVRFSMRHAENDEDTFMFEFGTTASTYESYKEQSFDLDLPFELCKIRDYKDRIYPLNGKWYLEKKIGKVVLNGSENWGLSQTQTNTLRFINITILQNGLATSNNKIICNMFTTSGTTDNDDYEHIRNAIIEYPTYLFVLINKTRLATQDIAGFKSWLSTHNTTVYYILNAPTTEEIAESNYPTLYNQLNNIKLYEGVNHLTFTNESGLDVEFDIEYYKDWKLD